MAMEWEGQRESENVEDERGSSGGGLFGTSMFGGSLPGGPVAFHGGLGSIVVIVILCAVFHINPLQLLQQAPQQGGQGGFPGAPAGQGGNPFGLQQGGGQGGGAAVDPAQDKLVDFVKVVLADTEDTWTAQFQKMGREYRKPKLVLFTGHIESACGFSSAAVGPFYCPEDEKVYLDLSFFDELQNRFHSPGNFAQAYVIAHEVGHHVQKLLGITDKVDAARRRASEKEANALSVRLELQADFLAGVWAHDIQQTKHVLDPGDIDNALRAASAIGDDRLQKQAQGYVVPDSFTHGTSAQRVKWFKKGFDTGDINQGDTFNTDDL
ncbi:MAG TPA: neutral zinc metallopeptidase [Pirellulales bacterium]|nr:neutral zinc metallopeptidase [Pirellulales bacterium]